MRRLVVLAALLFVVAGWLSARGQEKSPRTEVEKKALAKIQQLGGTAMELAQNDSRLEVSYQHREGKLTLECLVPLKDLKDLVHLNLRGQDVTDDLLAHLKGLTALTRLHLENTKITDKGLENLKGLTNLEYLNLYGTAVTDAGLVHLEGLKKLKNLYLWQTKATGAGAARLKKALVKTDIDRGVELEPPKVEKKPEPKKAEPKVEKKPEPKKTEPKVEKKPEPKKTEPKKDAKKKADEKKKS